MQRRVALLDQHSDLLLDELLGVEQASAHVGVDLDPSRLQRPVDELAHLDLLALTVVVDLGPDQPHAADCKPDQEAEWPHRHRQRATVEGASRDGRRTEYPRGTRVVARGIRVVDQNRELGHVGGIVERTDIRIAALQPEEAGQVREELLGRRHDLSADVERQYSQFGVELDRKRGEVRLARRRRALVALSQRPHLPSKLERHWVRDPALVFGKRQPGPGPRPLGMTVQGILCLSR